MMKTTRRIRCSYCLFLVVAVLTSCTLSGWKTKTEVQKESLGARGVFSWSSKLMDQEHEAVLRKAIASLECGNIYQYVPKKTELSDVLDYLNRRKQDGQRVYALCGDKNWAVERRAQSMLTEVDRVAEYNRRAMEADRTSGVFSGIVWDVEPYLLKEWKEDRETVMKQFVANLEIAYQRAGDQGLEVLVCIPFFYDNEGLTPELEQIVKKCSDGIAVMNYLKLDEYKQISTELELAKQEGKVIIHISELQEPGKHELSELNTYYHDGLEAVRESWSHMQEQTDYPYLGFAYHDLDTVIRLLGL